MILFDGYDLTIYGATVPGMIAEFGIDPTMAGLIGSGALVGMMLGAMIFGSLAERLGRRTSIVACVALYSVFTGVIAIASWRGSSPRTGSSPVSAWAASCPTRSRWSPSTPPLASGTPSSA
ncbi:MFS transporter [Pseudonocardia yuanmonensis]|uniref:MFS transporter n=1 Tax=Pseudonocardia yuanmonensis TaxID=1095914 RepID=UPI0031EF4F66